MLASAFISLYAWLKYRMFHLSDAVLPKFPEKEDIKKLVLLLLVTKFRLIGCLQDELSSVASKQFLADGHMPFPTAPA